MPYPYYPQFYQPQFQQQMQNNTPQIQNGGFVSVRSEDEARNYPVAPGTSITFKNEIAPYIYTKTMGFSQLDRPIFDRFKLIKEDVSEAQISTENVQTENLPQYALQADFEVIRGQIDVLQGEVDLLKEQSARKPAAKVKKEGEE